jgi:hypothetical protein
LRQRQATQTVTIAETWAFVERARKR